MPELPSGDWPVLKSYNQDQLLRIAMPIGGIGTGTVSLGGRGDLRDFEIMNRPAKGFRPGVQWRGSTANRGGSTTFFALNIQQSNQDPITVALEGPMDDSEYDGHHGSVETNHSLPRFRECSFHAAYPFGQVHLSDPEVPVDVRMEAFNPLVPGDADLSGIPLAILRFRLINRTGKELQASVVGSVENFVGFDGSQGKVDKARNKVRSGKGFSGVFMTSEGTPITSEQWGSIALATTSENTSARDRWANMSWGDSLLDFWEDFALDGRLDTRFAEDDPDPLRPGRPFSEGPVASVTGGTTVPAHGESCITFLLAWHFPNRMTWDDDRFSDEECCGDDVVGMPECCEKPPASCVTGGQDESDLLEPCCSNDYVGNYYAEQYSDAWDVLDKSVPMLSQLEQETKKFVAAFCSSDLPEVVKEAALFNVSTLRTQTCFRTPDGRFYGWEGCSDTVGCCAGSCTHVWNYEQATSFLFGELAMSMRDVEFNYATDERGKMSFRVVLPLEHRAREFDTAAADGQMGCIMKLHRDWLLSGNDDLLASCWPGARKALEFCWVEGGWDADRDGVMEGCQHNTMDVEYYGPNPQMGVWYLGALRAAEEMAKHLGDDKFASTCREMFENGSAWLDSNLFNGEYYEHKIEPITESAIAEGLRHPDMGARDLKNPELQLGSGCLVDQLVGQFFAHISGLGHLLNKDNIASTYESIIRHNFRQNFHMHFNHMRSYVLGDESGLLMATYPRGRRPDRPFPYYNEVMTGFEYSAAVGMLYENQTANGLKVIKAIRDRYNGSRRSPFDEAECGRHYARAMASWGAVIALSGFQYSGVDEIIEFANRPGRHFWSNGSAWGICEVELAGSAGFTVSLSVLSGKIAVKSVVVGDCRSTAMPKGKVIVPGRPLVCNVA